MSSYIPCHPLRVRFSNSNIGFAYSGAANTKNHTDVRLVDSCSKYRKHFLDSHNNREPHSPTKSTATRQATPTRLRGGGRWPWSTMPALRWMNWFRERLNSSSAWSWTVLWTVLRTAISRFSSRIAMVTMYRTRRAVPASYNHSGPPQVSSSSSTNKVLSNKAKPGSARRIIEGEGGVDGSRAEGGICFFIGKAIVWCRDAKDFPWNANNENHAEQRQNRAVYIERPCIISTNGGQISCESNAVSTVFEACHDRGGTLPAYSLIMVLPCGGLPRPKRDLEGSPYASPDE